MSTTAVSKSASDENKITGAAVGEKRGRGRPPKKVLQANNKEGSSSDNNTSSDDAAAAEAKKPRVEPENKQQSNSKVDASSSSVKRGRGRPPKEVKKDANVAGGTVAQDLPSIPVVKPVESAKTVIQKIASAAAALIPNIGGSGAAATLKDTVSLPTPAVAKTPQASNTTQTAKPVGTPATPASASSTPAQKGSVTPAADGSAKRGRGRPPKSNSNNRPATLQNGNAEPKGASTPDLTLSSPVAEGANSSAQKRGRGRPPKAGGAAAKKAPAAKPDGVKKGRGRPKKSAKGRGRPRKSQSTSQESSSQESEEYSSSESGEESDEKQGNSASDEGDATPAAGNTTSQ